MKLTTPVEFAESSVKISCCDRIMILGSCFADNIGKKLKDRGFDVCLNPFGTLYNPASISDSIARLDSGNHFTGRDCVQLGSGSGKWGSFHHHTLMARATPEEFLENANKSLDLASAFWKGCNKVMITLGTSWCYRFVGAVCDQGKCEDAAKTEDRQEPVNGIIVANCLKRDAKEFRREFLGSSETEKIIRDIVRNHPDKEFIFTVSPIRHFKDGAHGNQLSKAHLLTGLNEAIEDIGLGFLPKEPKTGKLRHADAQQCCDYFPAYEILLDELRDYRFYAEDMIHPSEQAANYIFERFIDWALPKSEMEEFRRREKAFRQSQHIQR